MKLWLLIRITTPDYSHAHSFVIRAASEEEARELARKADQSEDGTAWTDDTQSICISLSLEGEQNILLSDIISIRITA